MSYDEQADIYQPMITCDGKSGLLYAGEPKVVHKVREPLAPFLQVRGGVKATRKLQ